MSANVYLKDPINCGSSPAVINSFTWKPHDFNTLPGLDEPLLQELDLRRLAAPIQSLEDDEGAAGAGAARFRG